MTDDVDQVMAALRSAGWRWSEKRLRTTAVKRLATSRNHHERAAAKRDLARKTSDRFPDLHRRYLEVALRHEVRGAERCGKIPRAVRDVALRLVPLWTGG